MNNEIKVTVGLPLFNANKIFWLALESLCRQENINFKWELLICEENHENSVGVANIAPYMERLDKIGCVNVTYLALEEWVNLTEKWRIMFDKTDKNSEMFVLQAADCYSQKNRLRESYDLIKQGYDWVDYTNGLFYNIRTKQTISYTANALTNLDMAFSAKKIDRVLSRHINKGIDGHIFRCLNPKNKITLNRIGGVDTDGHNNISIKRASCYNKISAPFEKTKTELKDVVPSDITERLENLI